VARVRRLPNGSACTGKLPRGCELCEKGAKLVLLVTGKCGRRCLYCPLSSAKRGKDVFFANERRVRGVAEVMDEARLMDALGTGVTGGDPLMATDRTTRAIRALKREFGDGHHIHLYTATADTGKIAALARAGLDELRFHPPLHQWRGLEGSEFARAVDRSKELGMSTGLEIPAIPGRARELAGAIRFASDHGLDFVNLNELEFSETNWRRLRRLGFDVKGDVSSAVSGSEELAMSLLREGADIALHYCSASFKDGIQLRRRITRRARNVQRPHELLTDDGTFLKGVIETRTPARVIRLLLEEHGVPPELVHLDSDKKRVEVAPWVLEELAPELELESFIVEEYPTADRLEVEREPLTRR
jgi:pyruvate formate-lyase activating enzyme-like uncharacterized protein